MVIYFYTPCIHRILEVIIKHCFVKDDGRTVNTYHGWLKLWNSSHYLTGLKTVNYKLKGKKKLILLGFFIFSLFLTDFSQSEGKINYFSVKTTHHLKVTDGNKSSKKRTLDTPDTYKMLLFCLIQERLSSYKQGCR